MTEKVYSPEIIQTVKSLVPMDDALFQKICEDRATCEELISTIMGEQVIVVSVDPQEFIMNLQGRSVWLDCLCRLSNGTYVNVEVQRADDDDHENRVRYNASIITANRTPKGVKFRDVARVIVIYITQFDIFNEGRPIYHIDRMIRETHKVRNGGFTEIYVNAEAKNHDDELNGSVSDLMDLFTNRDRFDYHRFPHFSKRKDIFTNTERGRIEMCEKVERYAEYVYNQRKKIDLFEYVQRGKMSLRNAASEAGLSTEAFKADMIKNGYDIPEKRRKAARSVS